MEELVRPTTDTTRRIPHAPGAAAWLPAHPAKRLALFRHFVKENICCAAPNSCMRAVADVVVAGAGAAGLATAHFLKQLMPNSRIILVSRHAPFALTSSASTECFRDYWTSPPMRAFMRRSARLTEALACSSVENEARVALAKTGYLYVHQDCPADSGTAKMNEECSYLQPSDLQRRYPWLSPSCTRAVLANNAGWFSAHGLGMALLSTLQGSTMVGWDFVGATGLEDKIQGVQVRNVSTQEEMHISCGAFVNATGPLLSVTHQIALASLSSAPNAPLPVQNDVHAKVILHDTLRFAASLRFSRWVPFFMLCKTVFQCHPSFRAHDNPQFTRLCTAPVCMLPPPAPQQPRPRACSCDFLHFFAGALRQRISAIYRRNPRAALGRCSGAAGAGWSALQVVPCG